MHYYHTYGCGSGRVRSLVTIEDKKVSILVSRRWMGNKDVLQKFEGEYLSIDGPYGIIQFLFDPDEDYKYQSYINLDSYIFDKPLLTEWDQHPDKIGIGLYCGNGASSTTHFQLHIFLNQKVDNSYHPKYNSAVDLIDGMKYELISQETRDDILSRHFPTLSL